MHRHDDHLRDDDLVLHYYGELDGPGETRVAGHLAGCGACHGAYTRLQRVLAAVDAAPAPVPPEGFERTVWARLEPSLEGRRRHWLAWFVFSPARLAWAAAVMMLVAGAFFAGRLWQPGAVPPGTVPPGTETPGADIRERILLVDLSDHLDRSQMMLIELASADAGGAMDISAERERAGDLVAVNRLYRQTADATGDAAVSALLDELERVLVELAASPERLSAEDLARVQQRIESRGLLFKIRVVSSSVRERQNQAIRVRAGQSS